MFPIRICGKTDKARAMIAAKSASASATSSQTTTSASLADLDSMTVTLTLTVPCAVLLLAQVQLTVSAAGKPVTIEVTDSANALVGLAWVQDFHNTEEVCIVQVMALATGTVGANTWKIRWATATTNTATITNRYMTGLAFPS